MEKSSQVRSTVPRRSDKIKLILATFPSPCVEWGALKGLTVPMDAPGSQHRGTSSSLALVIVSVVLAPSIPRSQSNIWLRGCLLLLPSCLVDQRQHPSLVGFRIRQLKLGLIPFLKETLSFPQNQRSNMQGVLIDEVMLCEQPNQVGTSLHQHNPAGLVFQFRHFFRDIACDDWELFQLTSFRVLETTYLGTPLKMSAIGPERSDQAAAIS